MVSKFMGVVSGLAALLPSRAKSLFRRLYSSFICFAQIKIPYRETVSFYKLEVEWNEFILTSPALVGRAYHALDLHYCAAVVWRAHHDQRIRFYAVTFSRFFFLEKQNSGLCSHAWVYSTPYVRHCLRNSIEIDKTTTVLYGSSFGSLCKLLIYLMSTWLCDEELSQWVFEFDLTGLRPCSCRKGIAVACRNLICHWTLRQ
jgi:hypothetical protein